MRALAAFLLGVALVGAARAGALDDCGRRTKDAGELVLCLQTLQRSASDDMLEIFADVERRLRGREPAEARDAAVSALRSSQRDFERYVAGQCGFVHALAGGGALGDTAALACETDLLRQREAALQSLLPRARPN